MAPSREMLLSAAICLCTDFTSKSSTEAMLAHFTTRTPPTAIEHGHPSLAPFVGRTFDGREEVGRYFELLRRLLAFDNMWFNDFVVDTVRSKVSCQGHARFTWIATGQWWNETFTYMLDFVDEGAQMLVGGGGLGLQDVKVLRYQVWADTGAAYLASRGELKDS